MTEAPERIWALHYECEDEPDAILIGYPERFFGAHEYVRADRIEELKKHRDEQAKEFVNDGFGNG